MAQKEQEKNMKQWILRKKKNCIGSKMIIKKKQNRNEMEL